MEYKSETSTYCDVLNVPPSSHRDLIDQEDLLDFYTSDHCCSYHDIPAGTKF